MPLFGILLAAVGSLVCIGNWWLVLRYVFRRQKASLVPLIGGLSWAASLLIVSNGAARFAWLPLLLDPGCLPLILTAVRRIVWRRCRRH
jgi:hypothetical protein